MPPDLGILLDRTRRTHPDVCGFISEVVYEGRLDGLPELARQGTDFGTGLRYLPVDHAGNVAAAPEEAERVAREIKAMRAGSWTNRDGTRAPLKDSDFMVVAPYNAQVRRLRRALEAAGLARLLQRYPLAVSCMREAYGIRCRHEPSRPPKVLTTLRVKSTKLSSRAMRSTSCSSPAR